MEDGGASEIGYELFAFCVPGTRAILLVELVAMFYNKRRRLTVPAIASQRENAVERKDAGS